MVLRDRQQRIDCLQRVLRLNPSNGVALERLAQLQASAQAAKPGAAAKAEAPPSVVSAFTHEPPSKKPPVSTEKDEDLPAWASGALPPWPSAAAPAGSTPTLQESVSHP